MSRFYPVSADEMRELLKIEKGWTETVTGKEIVFLYNLKARQEITIKVFSGIRAADNQSRNVGQDAFRICSVNTKLNKGWIATTRCYRVEGWKNNLKEKILQTINDSINRKY